MWEALIKWWNGTSNPPGKVIIVKRIIINNYCGQSEKPKPPDTPTGQLVIPKGDSQMFIEFKNVPIPAAPTSQQVETGKLYIRVNGSAAVLSKPFDSYVPGAGGTASFAVPEGSSGQLSVTYIDKTGNESLPGLHTDFVNAKDEVAPDAPVGAIVLPQGDSIEDPTPNPFPPIEEPTEAPTEEPTAEPTAEPTEAPTEEPTAAPTVE